FSRLVVQKWPEPRELLHYSTPVRASDGFLGRLYVFRDVTHEREVDRMKTEFVSLVSHELRTPLTSIKGFTEMVLDGDAGEVNEEVAEYLGIVYSNAERLVALVNDLLDLSRCVRPPRSGSISLLPSSSTWGSLCLSITRYTSCASSSPFTASMRRSISSCPARCAPSLPSPRRRPSAAC